MSKTSKKLNGKTNTKLNGKTNTKLNGKTRKKLNRKTNGGTKRKKPSSSSKTSSSRKKSKKPKKSKELKKSREPKRIDLITLEEIDYPLTVIITKDNGDKIVTELDVSEESFIKLYLSSRELDNNNNYYVNDLYRRGKIFYKDNKKIIDKDSDVDYNNASTQEMEI